jgi:hypothetical protein
MKIKTEVVRRDAVVQETVRYTPRPGGVEDASSMMQDVLRRAKEGWECTTMVMTFRRSESDYPDPRAESRPARRRR